MTQATFDEVLEAIEHLPADEQAEILEVVRRRLAERGRRRVIEEIGEAGVEFGSGTTKPVSVDDLMREIGS